MVDETQSKQFKEFNAGDTVLNHGDIYIITDNNSIVSLSSGIEFTVKDEELVYFDYEVYLEVKELL